MCVNLSLVSANRSLVSIKPSINRVKITLELTEKYIARLTELNQGLQGFSLEMRH